jgi:hypothetical protein
VNDLLKAGDTKSRIIELEEALVLYARLKQRQEFLYTFRMIVYLAVHTNDFNRLAHMLVDFR